MIMASMGWFIKEKCSKFQLDMLHELDKLGVDGTAMIWNPEPSVISDLNRIDIRIGGSITFQCTKTGISIFTKVSGNDKILHYDEELAARYMAKDALKQIEQKHAYLTIRMEKLKAAIGGDSDE